LADTHGTSSGLDANVAAAFCYALGWVTGVLFLAIEPSNRFVRFHAWQSTVVFGALSVLLLLVRGVRPVGVLLTTFLIVPVSAILWLLLMFKAYQGERFKLPVAGAIAERRA
jgi:uncharacterized membrane protein